jgi:hypothetical protein
MQQFARCFRIGTHNPQIRRDWYSNAASLVSRPFAVLFPPSGQRQAK